MKIKLVILFAIAFSLMACENQENDFDDFGSTSVYFPFQTPVRTLIQGNYDLGFNDNDNNGRFEMGVTMSGVYENTADRKVFFEVDPDLISLTELGATDLNVRVLPEAYYTIEQQSPVTIPAGSIKGRIPVQLTDAFFDDPLSFVFEKDSVNYVIPLKITGYEGLDSLLTGVPGTGITNPQKVKDEDWATLPKDYTLFGIKFMNKYQGKYLRRGVDRVVGTSQTVVTWRATGAVVSTSPVVDINDSTVYKAENVVQDEVVDVATAGRNKAMVENDINRPGLQSTDAISLELTFDDNNEVVITNTDPSSPFVVTGTGRFVEGGDEWGGEKRDVIYLEYEYQDDVVTTEPRLAGFQVATSTVSLRHTVNDTLVIRNRDVRFEEFILQITP